MLEMSRKSCRLCVSQLIQKTVVFFTWAVVDFNAIGSLKPEESEKNLLLLLDSSTLYLCTESSLKYKSAELLRKQQFDNLENMIICLAPKLEVHITEFSFSVKSTVAL